MKYTDVIENTNGLGRVGRCGGGDGKKRERKVKGREGVEVKLVFLNVVI